MAPVTSAPAVILKSCNPYGHGTDTGPRHLAGGLYGPEYEGMKKWVCKSQAELRMRMTCDYGHRGQIMDLCREHAREIQRRQSDLCPPCAFPPEARSLDASIRQAQAELETLYSIGYWMSPQARMLREKIETMGHRMTELSQAGVIRKVPLTLTEVS